LHNLAALLSAREQFEEAEQLYRRALVIRESRLGSDAVDTALTRQNLGSLLNAMARFGEALPLLESAVSILEKRLMPGHPHISHARENLDYAIRSLTPQNAAD
jgi:tetratricopeptide (TPR) repeat protein